MHTVPVFQRRVLSTNNATKMYASLSAREKEVAWCIVLGYTMPETAERLGISVKTLDIYRSRIRAKFGKMPTHGIPLVMIKAKGEGWPKELELPKE